MLLNQGICIKNNHLSSMLALGLCSIALPSTLACQHGGRQVFQVREDQTYLHGTVEEAAVLAWLVQQSFGRGQGQHAPRLVRFPQIAPGPPEKLDPCHLITVYAFRSDSDRVGGVGCWGALPGPLQERLSDRPRPSYSLSCSSCPATHGLPVCLSSSWWTSGDKRA